MGAAVIKPGNRVQANDGGMGTVETAPDAAGGFTVQWDESITGAPDDDLTTELVSHQGKAWNLAN